VLPELSGRPIRVEVRRSLGSHLAATSIPRRLILLDAAVFARHGDFERILIHELFHFVWVRLSNQQRRAWEEVLGNELRARAKGELGWSAEWRKDALTRTDARRRTPRWRRYACGRSRRHDWRYHQYHGRRRVRYDSDGYQAADVVGQNPGLRACACQL